MKKFTKRLTMIVAILLSLVLLTSSIVSTTLAKYVVAKSAQVTATLQDFGLTVTLESNTQDGNYILTKDEVSSKQKGDSVSIKFTDVILKPGDETYKNAIKASIGGKANVPAKVLIAIDITCDDGAFKLTGEYSSDYKTTSKVYNPIMFCVNAQALGTAGVLHSVDSDDKALEEASETAIANAIKTKIVAGTGITANNPTDRVGGGKEIIGTIEKSADVALNDIGIGFYWPDDTSTTDASEIETFISNNENATFTITYTITVQQDTTKPTT